jgi:SAM-dependent methyltransferase
MDPNYSAFYRQLYEKHWWFRLREAWIVQVLRLHRPPEGWGSILDVGCGDGLFFDRLEEFGEVEGVEPSREIVNPASRYLNKIHFGPFDESFHPDKQYSLILLLDVLEHISDSHAALKRSMALLKPGGTLILTVPAFNALWTNHDLINQHIMRYRRTTLFPLLQQAGFTIEDSAYWFPSLFPVKLAQRFIERVFRLQPANPSIPSPSINRALSLFCSMEHFLLGPLRLPLGTTLFVRCTK